MRSIASNRNITFFLREHQQEMLDLTPEFQRRYVWTDDQASFLIDTILHELPFPEIYLRTKTSSAGSTRFEVVDGQQRLRSILRFASNDLVLTGENVSPTWNGKSFEDLTDKQKEAFFGYVIVTRELQSATDGDIRDIFRRLNIASVTLNQQELHHARFKNEFICLVKKLTNDD